MNRERGSATIHAIVVGSVLTLLTGIAVQGAMLFTLRHEVTKAADLAALAATAASVAGDDGCSAAREIARRNHARVVTCRMDFDVATLTARAESKSLWGQQFAFERRARAAPVDYLDSKR